VENGVALSLRVGVAILASGLVANYMRHTLELSRTDIILGGALTVIVVWLSTIPLTRLAKSDD